jgi:nucleotide-binding universal stress UspA family protein
MLVSMARGDFYKIFFYKLHLFSYNIHTSNNKYIIAPRHASQADVQFASGVLNGNNTINKAADRWSAVLLNLIRRRLMTLSEHRYPSEILLAVDGSEHFLAAVDFLNDLPLSDGCSVTAIAVIPTQQATRYSALEIVLEQTQKSFQKKRIPVIMELKAGNPAETINAHADDISPDLIVLGAIGLRATLGILLGGVAQQVVEYSRWPVLLVRAPFAGIKRVLLVIDGSEHSQRAEDYLARFSLPEGVDVSIMHVLPPEPMPDLIGRSWPVGAEMVMPVPSPEIEEAAKQQAEVEWRQGEVLLAQSAENLGGSGLKAGTVLLRGDAATEIIKYIKEKNVDLVVVGSRGLSQVGGWLLGSVSRKLVHYAGCSVLIVKGMPDVME